MSEVEMAEKPQSVSDTFVDMFWSPYEAFVAFSRKTKVNNEVWRKTYTEARKLGQDQREQAEKVYHEVVQKGNDLAFGSNDSLKKIAVKYEEIALTPMNFFLGQFDKMDHNWIERADEAEKSSTVYSNYLWNMHDTFTESIKTQQRSFFRLMNDGLHDWSRAGKGV